jgi:hypothetical protein
MCSLRGCVPRQFFWSRTLLPVWWECSLRWSKLLSTQNVGTSVGPKPGTSPGWLDRRHFVGHVATACGCLLQLLKCLDSLACPSAKNVNTCEFHWGCEQVWHPFCDFGRGKNCGHNSLNSLVWVRNSLEARNVANISAHAVHSVYNLSGSA